MHTPFQRGEGQAVGEHADYHHHNHDGHDL
jgi:hypothetical protein